MGRTPCSNSYHKGLSWKTRSTYKVALIELALEAQELCSFAVSASVLSMKLEAKRNEYEKDMEDSKNAMVWCYMLLYMI